MANEDWLNILKGKYNRQKAVDQENKAKSVAEQRRTEDKRRAEEQAERERIIRAKRNEQKMELAVLNELERINQISFTRRGKVSHWSETTVQQINYTEYSPGDYGRDSWKSQDVHRIVTFEVPGYFREQIDVLVSQTIYSDVDSRLSGQPKGKTEKMIVTISTTKDPNRVRPLPVDSFELGLGEPQADADRVLGYINDHLAQTFGDRK